MELEYTLIDRATDRLLELFKRNRFVDEAPVLTDFAEFSGISREVIQQRVRDCQAINAAAWNARTAKDCSFYEASQD